MNPPLSGPRILVLGAGAIGGVTAAQLARAGHDVVVLDADREHVALLNDPGLLLDELGVESHVKIAAFTDASQLEGRFDFCLIALKSIYLDAALPLLVERNLVESFVSLGNGLVQEHVRRLVGPERLLLGIVEWGATNLGAGHIKQTTTAPFVLGEANGTVTARVSTIADVLRTAAPGTRATDDITGQIWSKLLVNSTFSGLGAVGGVLYGDVVAHPIGRRVALGLWAEGHRVAAAAGIELVEVLGIHPDDLISDEPETALDLLMETVAATKASMLQDLERAAPTEVDVINGGIVKTATSLGLGAPLNAAVLELVHAYEAGVGRPTTEAFATIAAQIERVSTARFSHTQETRHA